MLNSAEHEIYAAHKYQNSQHFQGLISKASHLFILLTNVKMPTILGILTIVSRIDFMLSGVEHENCFISSELGLGVNSKASGKIGIVVQIQRLV